MAPLIGHGEATATMSYEHLMIRDRTRELAETPVEATDWLQELLYGLFALIEVHFRKEENIYAPFLERQGAGLARALNDVRSQPPR